MLRSLIQGAPNKLTYKKILTKIEGAKFSQEHDTGVLDLA